jgi:acetylglutamate/LysW-gamma-L-alpha-aminoadipate kinase
MNGDQNPLVVKLGGGAGLDIDAVCADLAELALVRPLVIVHGVSDMMAQLADEHNVPQRMLTSPTGHSFRYTDPETRNLYVQATGYVNHDIVSGLRAQGVPAVGLVDGVVINGERKEAVRALVDGRTRIIRDDYSGTITHVDVDSLRAILENGNVPVLPPLANSDDGFLNIDGDRASAAVAAALQADELVILSNVRGLYRNFPDEASFVAEVNLRDIDHAMQWAQGRMKRKVLGAQEAIAGGVGRVVIGDGRLNHPVTQALQGIGTVFTC